MLMLKRSSISAHLFFSWCQRFENGDRALRPMMCSPGGWDKKHPVVHSKAFSACLWTHSVPPITMHGSAAAAAVMSQAVSRAPMAAISPFGSPFSAPRSRSFALHHLFWKQLVFCPHPVNSQPATKQTGRFSLAVFQHGEETFFHPQHEAVVKVKSVMFHLKVPGIITPSRKKLQLMTDTADDAWGRKEPGSSVYFSPHCWWINR